MQLKFWVPGPLPGANEYINAERSNRMAAAKIKKDWTHRVAEKITFLFSMGGIQKFERVYISFRWVELNRRRDPDNIAFAKKFILDGMILSGLIPNDGWNQIAGFEDSFRVSGIQDNTGVEVVVVEVL